MFRRSAAALHAGALLHQQKAVSATSSSSSSLQVPPLMALYQVLGRHEANAGSASAVSAPSSSSSSSTDLSIVRLSLRGANDILHLIAQDLRDSPVASGGGNNNNHHHHHQPNASKRVPPGAVYQMVIRICEECSVHHSAAEAALASRRRGERSGSAAAENGNDDDDNDEKVKFSVQKNTLMTLLMGLARLAEATGADSAAGRDVGSASAERAAAALCEMSLPHVPVMQAPEWITIVNSFAKMKVLSGAPAGARKRKHSSNSLSSSSSREEESQRACAFMLHLALERLLMFPAAAESNNALLMMRVRDALNFAANLARMLPRAVEVMPVPHQLQCERDATPSWERLVSQLLAVHATVVEICTTDQAALLIQHGCQLAAAFCRPGSPSPVPSEVIRATAELIERGLQRIAATLFVAYDEQQQQQQQQLDASSTATAPQTATPFDRLLAAKLNLSVVLGAAPQLTGSVNNLFGTSVSAVKVSRDLARAAAAAAAAPSPSFSVAAHEQAFAQLFASTARLVRLCLHVAECGPQLLRASVQRQQHLLKQQQQEQQVQSSQNHEAKRESGQQDGEGDETGDSKSGGGGGASPREASGGESVSASAAAAFSNVLGQVMHVENNHVILQRAIHSILVSSAGSRGGGVSAAATLTSTRFVDQLHAALQQGGVAERLRASHAEYVVACASGSLRFFDAESVGHMAGLLHVLQCLSNRIEHETRAHFAAARRRTEATAPEAKETGAEADEDDDVALLAAERDAINDTNSGSAGAVVDEVDESASVAAGEVPAPTGNGRLVGGVLVTDEHLATLVPVLFQILSEIESRAEASSTARAQLFAASRNNFVTARRLTPFFSAAVLEPLLQPAAAASSSSTVIWERNHILQRMVQRAAADLGMTTTAEQHQQRLRAHAVSTAFKGLLRLLKAGLTQRPRPNLGPIVAVSNFAADEAPKTFDLLLSQLPQQPTSASDGSSSSSSSSSSAVLTTQMRDAMLLDLSSVLLEKCRALTPSSLPQLHELLGVAAALSRMHRCAVKLHHAALAEAREYQRAKELDDGRRRAAAAQQQQTVATRAATAPDDDGVIEKDDVEDDDLIIVADEPAASSATSLLQRSVNSSSSRDDAKRQLQLQMQFQSMALAASRLVAAADALCDDGRGALRAHLESRLDAAPTKLLLSFVQRLSPLLLATQPQQTMAVDSSPAPQQQQQQQHNILNLLAFVLLNALPARREQLSALEATLALSAMQAAKLWRRNVVGSFMAVVKDRHDAAAAKAAEYAAAAASVASAQSSSASASTVGGDADATAERLLRQKKDQAAVAAKEISIALVALCQLSASSSASISSAAAAADDDSEKPERKSVKGDAPVTSASDVIGNLVASLVSMPAEHVPVQSLLSVLRKMVQQQERQDVALGGGGAPGQQKSIDALLAALIPRVGELGNESSSSSSSSSSSATAPSLLSGDAAICIAALEKVVRHALDPLSGGRKARAATLQLAADLFARLLSVHVLPACGAALLAPENQALFQDLRLVCRVLRALTNARRAPTTLSVEPSGQHQQQQQQQEQQQPLLHAFVHAAAKTVLERRLAPALRERLLAPHAAASSNGLLLSQQQTEPLFADVFGTCVRILEQTSSSSNEAQQLLDDLRAAAEQHLASIRIAPAGNAASEPPFAETAATTTTIANVMPRTKLLTELVRLEQFVLPSSSSSSVAAAKGRLAALVPTVSDHVSRVIAIGGQQQQQQGENALHFITHSERSALGTLCVELLALLAAANVPELPSSETQLLLLRNARHAVPDADALFGGVLVSGAPRRPASSAQQQQQQQQLVLGIIPRAVFAAVRCCIAAPRDLLFVDAAAAAESEMLWKGLEERVAAYSRRVLHKKPGEVDSVEQAQLRAAVQCILEKA